MRLISETLRKLRIYEKEYRKGTLGRMIEETEEVLKEAADAIEMLLAKLEARVQNGEWIPCSERLPSAGRKVLLQTKGNQMVVAFLDKKNKWYVDSGDYFCTDLCAEPIAWQPLPEPYKEDMRGGKNE